jgi:predicted metal-dependent hydrolase
MLPSRDNWNDALAAFREGRYMEAHDAFESLWRGAAGQNREFFQGWVLLAAALFHRDRGNESGARRCFERAAEHWQRLPWSFRGLKISEVLRAVEEVLGQEWATPELPMSSPERSPAPRPQGGDRS